MATREGNRGPQQHIFGDSNHPLVSCNVDRRAMTGHLQLLVFYGEDMWRKHENDEDHENVRLYLLYSNVQMERSNHEKRKPDVNTSDPSCICVY